MSQQCNLLGFNLLTIWVISFSLKETLSITLSVRSWKGDIVLEFLTRGHQEANNLLTLTSSGNIERILMLNKKQYLPASVPCSEAVIQLFTHLLGMFFF